MTTTSGRASRRTLVAAAAAGAGSSAVLVPSDAAAALAPRGKKGKGKGKGGGKKDKKKKRKKDRKPGHHRGAKLLAGADRHLATRFSYGLTPALAAEVRRAGGGAAWFERQLDHTRVSDAGVPDHMGWFSGLGRSPLDLWKRQVADVESVWEVMADYQRACLLRRIHSHRQVHELMTEFWENHLHVPVNGDAYGIFRKSYGDTIRTHALGRFDQMLQATTVHPAMLVFLDGAVSTAKHPNENLGRELLELHTVGRGAFTEDDVKASARILTGWSVDMWRTWASSYSPTSHWTGPVRVLGFTDPNASSDGRAVTMAYLRYLAHHPSTARRIARRLAVKFVRDDPSPALVEHLARVYLQHDTAIKPVLRALVASAEFKGSAGLKVRDPGEDLVATYRALRVRIDRPPEGPRGDEHGASAFLWQASSIGTTPYGWPRPDGQPIDNESWASPSRMIASMQVHWSLSGGWWPKVGMGYRTPAQWLPRKKIRFDDLVDHLSQELLGQRSTGRLLAACCQAVDVRPADKITADHGVVRWSFPRLLTTFLDSPTHLTR